MTKVVLLAPNQAISDIFRRDVPAGFEVVWRSSRLSDDEKAACLADADYLVLHPAEIGASVLERAPRLKHIQLLTAGYDRIDLDLTHRLGISVATNGGANALGAAEHTVALLLALTRKLLLADRSVRDGSWQKHLSAFDTFEVAGKVVGVIGAGTIGRMVASRLKAFEAEIVYCHRRPSPEMEAATGARRLPLEELLARADVVTLHVPLTPETRGMIGAREFARMKPSVVILNLSRGEIVDEAALLGALRGGRIAGAGLDVFPHEPLALNDPLLALENVVLTPHTAGHAFEGWVRRSRLAWDNIRRVAGGETPRFLAGG